MAKVKVMTDSVACIPMELAEKYEIKVIPTAQIYVDSKTYIEGVTLSHADAYQLIKDDPDRFLTSALAPEYILEAYKELSAKSRDIVFISISASLSAISATAGIAANSFREQFPETNIRIVDSKACASTEGLVVLAAARAAAQGKNIDEVVRVATETRQKAGGLMLLDTLRYVYRTGRMSKTAARLVSLLNIKPINRLTEDGKIEMVTRTRKRSDGLERMLNLIGKEVGPEGAHFMVTHANVPDVAESFADQLKERFKWLSMVISYYSPVMGYGAGPGAIFVGFHPELDVLK